MHLNNYKFIDKVKLPVIFIWMILASISSFGQEKNYRLIFSANLLQNQKIEDAIATTKILAKNIERKMELKENIDITVCKSLDELTESIKTPFDFVLATSVEIEKLRKKYKLEPVLVNETDGAVGFEFYLITNSTQNYTNLKSLKNCSINILSKSEYNTASVWLDKLLREQNLGVKEKFFKEIKYDYKSTNVVLPVYFNKSEAAIVSKTAFNLLCELNPQLKKTLRILDRSNPIIFGAIAFDGRSDDKKRKDFMYDILIDLHKDSYGKQMFDLFMVDKVIPLKKEYWQDFLDLYK